MTSDTPTKTATDYALAAIPAFVSQPVPDEANLDELAEELHVLSNNIGGLERTFIPVAAMRVTQLTYWIRELEGRQAA